MVRNVVNDTLMPKGITKTLQEYSSVGDTLVEKSEEALIGRNHDSTYCKNWLVYVLRENVENQILQNV